MIIKNEIKFWDFFQIEQRKKFKANENELKNIIKEIKRYKGNKVLDVGFGSGFLLQILARQRYSCYGIDFSQNNIDHTKNIFDKKGLKVILKNSSATNLPFKEKYFDFVILAELLEHLSKEDCEKCLQEVDRCIKKNGYIIITVPNKEKLEENFVLCPYCNKKFHKVLHKQFFDQKKLKNLLKNYKIVKIKELHEVSEKFPLSLKLFYIIIKKIFKIKGSTLLMVAKKI